MALTQAQMEAALDPVRPAHSQAGLLSDALRNVERNAGRARRDNTRVSVTAIIASALSAVMAGIPAAMNQAVVGTWRSTCLVTSVLSAVAAIATGLQTQFRHAERLAEATDCLGRLRALEVQHRLGGVAEADFNRQFSEIVARYPGLV